MCMDTSGRSSSQARSVVVGERRERRVGDRAGRRGPRPRVEQRQLAEHLARADHAEQVLPAVGRRPGELDLAVQHHVQPVAVLSLQEEMLAPGQLDVWHLPPERPRALLVEPFEQRCPPEHNFGVLHRILLAGLSAAGRRQRAGQRPSWPCSISVNHSHEQMCSGSHSRPRPGGNSDETNITSRRKIATLSSREHRGRDGSGSGGGWGLRGARGTGGKARRAGGSQLAVPARRAYRCRPPGGLTGASGPEGLSWLSTWP